MLSADAPKVGVPEVGRQLQPVAERAIHPDVGGEHGTGQRERRNGGEPSDRQDGERGHQVVGQVVGDGAEARPAQVADHRDVRREQERQEPQRMPVGLEVDEDAGHEDGERLATQDEVSAAHRGAQLTRTEPTPPAMLISARCVAVS